MHHFNFIASEKQMGPITRMVSAFTQIDTKNIFLM
jgi:hypothetical protein